MSEGEEEEEEAEEEGLEAGQEVGESGDKEPKAVTQKAHEKVRDCKDLWEKEPHLAFLKKHIHISPSHTLHTHTTPLVPLEGSVWLRPISPGSRGKDLISGSRSPRWTK